MIHYYHQSDMNIAAETEILQRMADQAAGSGMSPVARAYIEGALNAFWWTSGRRSAPPSQVATTIGRLLTGIQIPSVPDEFPQLTEIGTQPKLPS